MVRLELGIARPGVMSVEQKVKWYGIADAG